MSSNNIDKTRAGTDYKEWNVSFQEVFSENCVFV